MRLPRFRFRIRTFLLLVALVALALVGQKIYRDGPETHWLLLRLRFGSVQARRSAAAQAFQGEGLAIFHELFGVAFSGSASPRTLEAVRLRRRRRAGLLLPALVRAAEDPDPGCRAEALRALGFVAALDASDSDKSLVLRQILAATHDREDSVRMAAVGSLSGLASRDTGAVLDAIRSALGDPSIEVREKATYELGMLGVIVPTSQPDAASILIPLLASREVARVRAKAAWGMCYFGVDGRRHSPETGPDVVPALVAALDDPDVDVRRTAAVILGSTTFIAGGGKISAWDQRKGSIIPALDAATADDDEAVREEPALALFALGRRDPVVIELIEQAVDDPARSQKSKFESALQGWEAEQEASAAVEPADPSDSAP